MTCKTWLFGKKKVKGQDQDGKQNQNGDGDVEEEKVMTRYERWKEFED